MSKKLASTIISSFFLASVPFSSFAEMRSELSVGHNTLGFDTGSNSFISSRGSEGSDLKNLHISGYIADDFNETVGYVVSGKYVNYQASGFDTTNGSNPKDDTPIQDMSLEATVLTKISEKDLLGISAGYVAMDVAQDGTEFERKNSNTLDVSFASQYDKFSYMLTAGMTFGESEETQDYLAGANYYGVVLDYQVQDKVNVGLTYDSFAGELRDLGSDGIVDHDGDQSGNTASIYAEYQNDLGRWKVGYKHYEAWSMDPTNGGPTDKANGKSVFVSFSMPFGGQSSKPERMIITQKPNVAEFVNIAGSIMD